MRLQKHSSWLNSITWKSSGVGGYEDAWWSTRLRWLDIAQVLFLLCIYGPRCKNEKKRMWPISSHLDQTSVINKQRHCTWHIGHNACSDNQSQCRICFISKCLFPTPFGLSLLWKDTARRTMTALTAKFLNGSGRLNIWCDASEYLNPRLVD